MFYNSHKATKSLPSEAPWSVGLQSYLLEGGWAERQKCVYSNRQQDFVKADDSNIQKCQEIYTELPLDVGALKGLTFTSCDRLLVMHSCTCSCQMSKLLNGSVPGVHNKHLTEIVC
jgi:hypothetical protein